jgi:hypothetical protein
VRHGIPSGREGALRGRLRVGIFANYIRSHLS